MSAFHMVAPSCEEKVFDEIHIKYLSGMNWSRESGILFTSLIDFMNELERRKDSSFWISEAKKEVSVFPSGKSKKAK